MFERYWHPRSGAMFERYLCEKCKGTGWVPDREGLKRYPDAKLKIRCPECNPKRQRCEECGELKLPLYRVGVVGRGGTDRWLCEECRSTTSVEGV